MFSKGDDVFIVDNGRWKHKNEIVIQKRKFEHYTSNTHKFLVFGGVTSMQIASWAVFPTIDDATKFTIAYIIKTECFGETIEEMDGLKEYKILEETHPDLIFKYMAYVVNQIEQ